VFALLILGRLSNHHGRRPVSIAALLVAIAGCITLLFVHSFPVLLLGRALQGLAAGLASSAIGAYAVDTVPQRPKWLVATVTTAAATIGLALDVFIAGTLVEFARDPRELTYIVFGLILLGCAITLATRREIVSRTPGAWSSLFPRRSVPRASRPYLSIATAVFVATWAFGGYFTSFGPSIADEDLGSQGPLVASAVFASYMAPGFIGGFIAGRFLPATAQRIGMTLVAVAGIGLAFASTARLLSLFILAGVIGRGALPHTAARQSNAPWPHRTRRSKR
jgi:MFS family permease